MGLINTGIAVMSLLLVAFIFSFSGRQTQSGIPIEVKFPSLPDTPKLAIDIYEENPIFEVEVEILNGCGEPGLAAKFSDLLRKKQVDVVRSENADHFEYAKTILIQRNENVKGMKNATLTSVINESINQSMSRTIITSLTTLFVVLVLFIVGGEVIHTFAFAMIVGVIIGTYSSIFVASPVVIKMGSDN